MSQAERALVGHILVAYGRQHKIVNVHIVSNVTANGPGQFGGALAGPRYLI